MKAVVVTRTSGYDAVRVEERPDPPPPGPGDVRIDVRAAGVNFADLLARQGLYPDSPKLPAVLGYEVTGTVESVGDGVTTPAAGDRVIAATHFGGQAELAIAHSADCMPLPERMSFEEGAAIPVNYGTAWAAAMIMGGLRAGDTMLVHQAAGGVGIAATQIGADAGATVIGTASAPKHAAVCANGATHVIDYRTADVAAEVLRVTGGRGVDVALDALGPASFRQDYGLLRPGGRLIVYGLTNVANGERRDLPRAFLQAARVPFALVPWWKGIGVISENKGVFGLNLLSWWHRECDLSRLLVPIRDGLEAGALRPVVAETFPFSRAGDAHRYLQEARNIGKVVLVPG